MNILVTGAKGQLGQCIQSEIERYNIRNNYFFEGSDTVNILSVSDIRNYVIKNSIDIIINCAAYTAVDKAEEMIDICRKVNKDGPANIAKVCEELEESCEPPEERSELCPECAFLHVFNIAPL